MPCSAVPSFPRIRSRPSPISGGVTEIYGVVRWHDDELDDDFVILRTFTRKQEAVSVLDQFREREPDQVFNLVVLQT